VAPNIRRYAGLERFDVARISKKITALEAKSTKHSCGYLDMPVNEIDGFLSKLNVVVAGEISTLKEVMAEGRPQQERIQANKCLSAQKVVRFSLDCLASVFN
jgi:hypothetical protein